MAAVASLSEGAIIGIAVAGSTAFLLVLVSTGLRIQNKRDQKTRNRLLHIEAQPLETKELAAFLRSERPRDDYIPNSLNVVPSLPHQRVGSIHVNTAMPADLLDEEPELARANTKRLSPTRALSRLSTGIRDSWPLANSGQMPNALQGLARLQSQSQSTITLNQVAPPGYLITSDPKYPNRTYSRNLKTKVSKDVAGHHRPLQPTTNRHSSQLTTILRSTSERLKPSQSRRKSLSRTLTSFNRSGPPPSERLPSPHRTVRVKESCEALIDNRSTVSIDSELCDEEILRTPSLEKQIARNGGKEYLKQYESLPSTCGTSDSLCNVDIMDQAITVPLSSPSKKGRAESVHGRPGVSPVRMSPVELKDYPSILKRQNRASVQALGRPLSEILSAEEQDPFYPVNHGISNLNGTRVGEPRPLFIRKSTGSVSNQISPLKDISGNSQALPRRDAVTATFDAQHDPFQWTTQESDRNSPTSTKPRKKGHKRSKTVRMSVLPAAPSSVSMVPEESEESDTEPSPLKFHVPSPRVRIVEPSKSPSRSPGRSTLLQRRQQNKPPSMPRFDPKILVQSKMPMGRTMSSPSGDVQIYSPTMPSPAISSPSRLSPIRLSPMRLSPTFRSGFDSQNEPVDIITHNPKLSPNTMHSRRECSVIPATSPTTLLDEMIGFPRPPTTVHHSHREKKSINFVPSSFSVLPTTRPISVQKAAQIHTTLPPPSKSPALSPNSEILKILESHKVPPPVLTLPFIPGHLTGPRDLPPKFATSRESKILSKPPSPSPSRSQTQKVPRKDSLHQSICMLRRMNSDVSGYESPTSTYSRTERSPSSSPLAPNFRRRTTRSEIGSRCYHNINSSTSHRLSATSSRSKHRISKPSPNAERRISKILKSRDIALEREISLQDLSSSREVEYIVDATPLDPMIMVSSSPVTESENDLSSLELRFSSQSKAGTVEYSLPDLAAVGGAEQEEIIELESPVRAQNWSDNIPKNSYPIQSSKIEPLSTWNNIVLTPSGEESKENAVPRNSRVHTYLDNSRDNQSVRSSVVSSRSRRGVRNSAVSMNSPQVHRNLTTSTSRKDEARLSASGARHPFQNDMVSEEIDRLGKGSSVKQPSTDKQNPNKLRKKPRSMWINWNNSPRESLYDSDGFLRSSPARISRCS